jgi:uncharacterized protein YgbK (DUF1537 family)
MEDEPMIHLLIIADDLTGANDTGVQFTKKGLATLVTTDLHIDLAAVDAAATVLVIDTESRHLVPEAAAWRVQRIARRAQARGVRYFYKKTDSTLRGNIGAELTALMEAVAAEQLMFVPAFPRLGRFTRRGYHYVGEQLLHESVFARDPREPVRQSFIPDILATQTDIPGIVVVNAASWVPRPGKSIYVFDCQTDEDLVAIGTRLAARHALCVTAGAAGFAAVLPDLLHLPQQKLAAAKRPLPLLIVNGSLNEVALAQVAGARRRGYVDLAVPGHVLLATAFTITSDVQDLARQASRAAAAHQPVLLRTIERRADLGAYIAAAGVSGVPLEDLHGRAARNMGALVKYVLAVGGFKTCAVFGGDTALGMLTALGRSAVRPIDEIAPGVIWSQLVGSDLHLITKAGGFGEEDLLLRIAAFFGKES